MRGWIDYNVKPAAGGMALYLFHGGWGRFIQADTLIPGVTNPLALDRYATVQNNPINGTDPSGKPMNNG